MIAGTFDMLQNPQTEIRQVAKQAAGVAALAAPATDALPLGSKPTTRVVQATVVRAGTPVVPAPPVAPVASEPPANLVATADPAIDPKAWVDVEPQPAEIEVALVTPEDMPIPAPLERRPPAPGSLDQLTITVGDSAVNVRSGPDQASKRLFGLPANTELQAVGASGNWLQVKDAKGRTGWVFLENLVPPDPKAVAALPKVDAPVKSAAPAVAETGSGDVRFVGGSGVNVRSSATRGAKSLFTLRAGAKVTITGTEHGWLKIKDDQGRSGWVYKDFVGAKG